MKDVRTSNLSPISRKPLQWVHVATRYAGHVVEVMSRSHCNNAYGLFSDTKGLSSNLFNGGENNSVFKICLQR